MANTNNNDTPILWATVASKSLNSAAYFASDAMPIHVDDHAGTLQITVDNSGTPAAGDTVECRIAYSADGTTYDTEEHSQWVATLDTVAASTPGEDPAIKSVRVNVLANQYFKLLAKAPQGATRAITISAVFNARRA